MPLADQLTEATKETLTEVNREAESTLSAQLTIALAADQRAISFASVLAAAIAVIGGGSVAAFGAQSIPAGYGWAGVVAAIGLLAAMFLSWWSAMPAKFHIPGNDPASWEGDIGDGLSIRQSLAQQASLYQEWIKFNNGILAGNARLMKAGFWSAWGGLAIGLAVVALTALTSQV